MSTSWIPGFHGPGLWRFHFQRSWSAVTQSERTLLRKPELWVRLPQLLVYPRFSLHFLAIFGVTTNSNNMFKRHDTAAQLFSLLWGLGFVMFCCLLNLDSLSPQHLIMYDYVDWRDLKDATRYLKVKICFRLNSKMITSHWFTSHVSFTIARTNQGLERCRLLCVMKKRSNGWIKPKAKPMMICGHCWSLSLLVLSLQFCSKKTWAIKIKSKRHIFLHLKILVNQWTLQLRPLVDHFLPRHNAFPALWQCLAHRHRPSQKNVDAHGCGANQTSGPFQLLGPMKNICKSTHVIVRTFELWDVSILFSHVFP